MCSTVVAKMFSLLLVSVVLVENFFVCLFFSSLPVCSSRCVCLFRTTVANKLLSFLNWSFHIRVLLTHADPTDMYTTAANICEVQFKCKLSRKRRKEVCPITNINCRNTCSFILFQLIRCFVSSLGNSRVSGLLERVSFLCFAMWLLHRNASLGLVSKIIRKQLLLWLAQLATKAKITEV